MSGEKLKVLPQYLMPKRLITELAGKLASGEHGGMTTKAIRWFIKRYQVNMAEALNPDPASYKSFNAFFTRPLKDGARPLADSTLVCPVDGAISQCGPIVGEQIFQAKGHSYTATTLLGNDSELAKAFIDGTFATLYLSPKDYHRIHMPCQGKLKSMRYVPGDLYSVNPLTARNVPGLFARNERLVCVFDGEQGPFVMVLVGATIVGSMATVWHGLVNPPRAKDIIDYRYDNEAIVLNKGDEMGRFLLGSTVVLLFPKNQWQLPVDWTATRPIRMGEAMSTV